ncbi:MAG: sigma-E factor negative regulatory protein [Burkholderiales bacterium]|nr:sigma-E factor negative regulatory protein [Burkholderiales bacterium]
MDRVSELMDGEQEPDQALRTVAGMRQQDELRECWDTFHLIGDTLRGDCHYSPRFSRRFAERLAQEPTVLAPRRSTVKRFTTYALSAAASLCAVAVVGWVALSVNNPLASDPRIEVAEVPASVVTVDPVPAPAPVVVSVPSEGKMNEYLLAHQGFSPSTAIQGVAPYIRSVSASQSALSR